jgi:hypothetical protein
MAASVAFHIIRYPLRIQSLSLAPEEWPPVMGKRNDANAESPCLSCTLFMVLVSAFGVTYSNNLLPYVPLSRLSLVCYTLR